MKEPTAIICSDLHIMGETPVCRTDDFMLTQARKYKWLSDLQRRYDVPILVAGDLFNHWKPSLSLLGWCFRNLPDGIIAVAGQHDLPAHNMANIEKSGIQCLADAGKIKLLGMGEVYIKDNVQYVGMPWGTDLTTSYDLTDWQPTVALIHYGVYESKPHYVGAELSGGTAKSLMKKLYDFDLIASGDNHLTFVTELGNQLLINAGSFTRTTAAQTEHKPCVFLWYADSNEFDQVFIPIEKAVVSREHIDTVVARDERLEAFISRLNTDIDDVSAGVAFKQVMKNYLSKNTISTEVKNIILEVLDHG